MTDADNFTMSYPKDIDPRLKAAMAVRRGELNSTGGSTRSGWLTRGICVAPPPLGMPVPLPREAAGSGCAHAEGCGRWALECCPCRRAGCPDAPGVPLRPDMPTCAE